MMKRLTSAPGKYLVLVPILFFVVLHFWQLPSFDQKPANREHGIGHRLMTTVDAYFFIRLADDLLKDQYTTLDSVRPTARPFPPPALSSMAASIVRATGIPLADVAFFLPPMLAILMIPLMWVWSRRIFPDDKLGAVIASSAVSINYAFYTRTTLGKFDTDALNIVLFWAIGFLLYEFTRRSGIDRFLYLGLALLSLFGLGYWWFPAGLPLGLIMFFFFGCSIILPSPKRDKWLKGVILGGAAVGGVILVLAGFTSVLPKVINDLLSPYMQHLTLIQGETKSLFPAMGKTIAELQSLDWKTTMKWIAGSWFVPIIAVAGLLVLVRRERRTLFFVLLPCLFFGIMSFEGLRFIMFLAPGIALGIAAFALKIVRPVAFSLFDRASAATAMAVAAAVILIAPGTVHCMSYGLRASFDGNMVLVAQEVNKKAGKSAFVWNWWGPGYMIENYSQRKTFIDGGLQEPQRSWIAAVPLATHNYTLARNWIRFFAKNPMAITYFSRLLKDTEKATAFLLEALKDKNKLSEVLEKYGLPKTKRNWAKFLFPETEVYLVLLSDMLTHGSWLPIGKYVPGGPDMTKRSPFYAIPNEKVMVNTERGQLLLPEGRQLPMSRFYIIRPNELRHDVFKQSGVVVIGVSGTDYVIYMDEDHLNTLALHLLFVSPDKTPGFTPVRYNPFVGGAWRVD